MAKKSARSKGFRKQNVKKPYLSKRDIVILCIIVAALAVAAFFLFRYDDGALKVKDGAVVADGDNWLIVDGSNVRGRSRYFRLGEIGEIDGYSREKSALLTDANVPEYVFTPAEEGGGDVSITVTCSHGSAQTMSDYSRTMLDNMENTTASEIQTAQLSGQDVRYYSYAADYTAKATGDTPEDAEHAEAGTEDTAAEAEEGARYARSIAGYVDASHESCIVLKVISRGDTDDDCLPDEAMIPLLEQAVAAVTLDAEK